MRRVGNAFKYGGPGSWSYAFCKCAKCSNEAPRGTIVCQKCKEKEARKNMRGFK